MSAQRHSPLSATAIGLLLAGSIACSVRTQGVTWREAAPVGFQARRDFAYAADPDGPRILVHGGLGPFSTPLYGDTWEFDGADWTVKSTSPAPGPRFAHGLAYDAHRERFVMFGGAAPRDLDETWEWDGRSWRRRRPATSPPSRYYHAMTYDSRRRHVLVFGGTSIDRLETLGDLWAWDGTTWTLLDDDGPELEGISMAYDVARDRTVVFTGGTGTLEWDGRAWSVVDTDPSEPGVRQNYSMTYDAARQRVIMFTGGLTFGNDAWEWDGSDWTRLPTPDGMRRRMGYGMGFLARPDRTLVFSGRDPGSADHFTDVWEGSSTTAATLDVVGTGCAGTAGAPKLDAKDTGRPWLGERLELRGEQLPPTRLAVPFGLLGFSDRRVGDLDLPLPLDSIGMSGCTLFTSADVDFGLTNAFGTTDWPIPIPAAPPALLGRRFHMQLLVADAPANPP
jgi:hypothetical protein